MISTPDNERPTFFPGANRKTLFNKYILPQWLKDAPRTRQVLRKLYDHAVEKYGFDEFTQLLGTCGETLSGSPVNPDFNNPVTYVSAPEVLASILWLYGFLHPDTRDELLDPQREPLHFETSEASGLDLIEVYGVDFDPVKVRPEHAAYYGMAALPGIARLLARWRIRTETDPAMARKTPLCFADDPTGPLPADVAELNETTIKRFVHYGMSLLRLVHKADPTRLSLFNLLRRPSTDDEKSAAAILIRGTANLWLRYHQPILAYVYRAPTPPPSLPQSHLALMSPLAPLWGTLHILGFMLLCMQDTSDSLEVPPGLTPAQIFHVTDEDRPILRRWGKNLVHLGAIGLTDLIFQGFLGYSLDHFFMADDPFIRASLQQLSRDSFDEEESSAPASRIPNILFSFPTNN